MINQKNICKTSVDARRPHCLSAILLLAILLVLSSSIKETRAQDKISPMLRVVMEGANPGEKIPIIVTLEYQVPLNSIRDGDRGRRLEQLVRKLKAESFKRQHNIRSLLTSSRVKQDANQITYFWVFNGIALQATPELIQELAQFPEVAGITKDQVLPAPIVNMQDFQPEPNIELINAPSLWALGYQGAGIVVANMDTGVDLTHPDLVNNWRGGSNSWFDPYGEHPDLPVDYNGHGTATMGVMVAGDVGGTAVGVAPQARWIAVKIFNDRDQATTSAIHMGFQWLLDPDGDPKTPDAPHIVNNSWLFLNPGCNLEFQLDLRVLRTAGILPIFSAGNFGPSSFSSRSPANNPEAFAVGAVDNDDLIYYESSRGPSACSDGNLVYPELVAPGVNIMTTERFGQYFVESGTSLSAPHVSGGLALLLNAFPSMTADIQQAALANSAIDLGATGPDYSYGHGRLDLLAAYNWLKENYIPPTPTPTPDLPSFIYYFPIILN
jgi:serine protease AprX